MYKKPMTKQWLELRILNNIMLEKLFTNWSRQWWLILFFALCTAITIWQFQIVGETMKNTIGYLPFDLQTPLALADVQNQLPAYTETAKQQYIVFLLWDTAFPFFVSVTLCLILARALIAFYALRQQPFTGNWLVLIPFNAAIMDWLENMAFSLTIWNSVNWGETAVLIKTIKVILSVIITSSSVLIFAFVMLILSLRQYLKK